MNKIFIVNDDGYNSPGLLAIINKLKTNFDLSVVSSKTQRSWTGKSISYRDEVKQTETVINEQKVIVIDGTPADCANIGLNHFCKPQADLVVSGINIGANITTSWTLSSATVGAALEAAILGYQAVSLSQRLPTSEVFVELTNNPQPSQEKYFSLSSHFGKQIAERLVEKKFPSPVCLLNFNFPPEESYQKKWRLGKPYNWNYGNIFQEIKKGVFKKTSGEVMRQQDISDTESDVWLINHGYVSITPYALPLCPVFSQEIKQFLLDTFPEYMED